MTMHDDGPFSDGAALAAERVDVMGLSCGCRDATMRDDGPFSDRAVLAAERVDVILVPVTQREVLRRARERDRRRYALSGSEERRDPSMCATSSSFACDPPPVAQREGGRPARVAAVTAR